MDHNLIKEFILYILSKYDNFRSAKYEFETLGFECYNRVSDNTEIGFMRWITTNRVDIQIGYNYNGSAYFIIVNNTNYHTVLKTIRLLKIKQLTK